MNAPITVVKMGGELLLSPEITQGVVHTILKAKTSGERIVLVHGGGPQITALMEKTGKKAQFLNGFRVTDQETMELTAMALVGKLSLQLVAAFNEDRVEAVALSGVDGKLLSADVKNPDLGFVGELKVVRPDIIQLMLGNNLTPVVSPIGLGASGQLFNINADIVAGRLAVALSAPRLIILSNIPGLYREFGKEETLLTSVPMAEAECLLRSGALSAGMIPKLQSVVDALRAGVSEVRLIDGRSTNALAGILEGRSIGTHFYQE